MSSASGVLPRVKETRPTARSPSHARPALQVLLQLQPVVNAWDPILLCKTLVTTSKTAWLQERVSHVPLAQRERWPTVREGGVSVAARA